MCDTSKQLIMSMLNLYSSVEQLRENYTFPWKWRGVSTQQHKSNIKRLLCTNNAVISTPLIYYFVTITPKAVKSWAIQGYNRDKLIFTVTDNFVDQATFKTGRDLRFFCVTL
jgi:hypothetical protein